MKGYQRGGGGDRMEGKGTRNKKHKWQVKNIQGEVKNSIGNGEAKELICTSHGHEHRQGNAGTRGGAGRRGGAGQWGIKRRKKMRQL